MPYRRVLADARASSALQVGSFSSCARRALRRSRAIALFTVLTVLVAPAAAQTPPEADLKLGVGDELFWDGEEIAVAAVPDPRLCGIAGECFEYKLELEQGDPGTRLRVALHATLPEQEGDVRVWPDPNASPDMAFKVQLFQPGSNPQTEEPVRKGSTFVNEFGVYAVELFVGGSNDLDSKDTSQAPVSGAWTIRVIPESVVDMAFRMRAKLEAPAPDPVGLLSPNLRIIPPFELGFPVTTGSFGPGVPGGPGSGSCMATEITEPLEQHVLEGSSPDVTEVPRLCLRYSMGLENAGDGPFRLVNQVPAGTANRTIDVFGLTERPLIQQVCDFRGDGCQAQEVKNGPTGRFHARHLHVHYQNAYFFQLFGVDEGWRRGDPTPELEAVTDGRKLGLSTTQEKLADWGRFYQRPPNFFGKQADTSGCPAGPFSEGGPCDEIRLQAGWGDLYEWNRDGNYVDFPHSESLLGMPREGFYVLRGTADRDQQIVESDKTDNDSYAFFEVTENGKVELIERGYGTDPWDPDKVVLTVSP